MPPFYASSQAHDTLPQDFLSEFHNLGAQVGENLLPGRGLVVLHRGDVENPVVFAMSTACMLITFLVLLGLSYAACIWLAPGRRIEWRERWAGGVRQLLPEMTYTGTGFSNSVRVIFDAIF